VIDSMLVSFTVSVSVAVIDSVLESVSVSVAVIDSVLVSL